MRFVRFLALLGATLALYTAQYIFVHGGLEELPPRLLSLLPSLRDLAAWSPDKLRLAALVLAGTGAVLFGLAARFWPSPLPARGSVPIPSALTPTGALLVGLGLLVSAGLGISLGRGAPETLSLQWTWAGALALFVIGAWLLDGRRPIGGPEEPRPERSWPFFVLIWAGLALLLAWQLDSVPLRVDGDPASHGLQALDILAGRERRIFAPGWANIPLIAYYPAALGMLVSGDPLLGNRLAGLYAGLLTLTGVWLLGCELFRRPAPRAGAQGPLPEDGRTLALLAVGFTGIGYTFVHFSRLPQYMEPVAWGTLALWALLRGLRTGDRTALGLSGLLLGLSTTLYYSGRVFLVIAVLWWIGSALARTGPRAATRHPAGGGGLGVWLAGIFVFTAPFLGYWLRMPQAFLTRIQEVSLFNPAVQAHMAGVYGVDGLNAILWENTQRAFLTFNIYGDKSTHFGYPGPMLDSLTAPLLLLGVGFLLFHLNRLMSWQLLSWLVAVIVLGGALTVNTPFWPRLLPALPVAGLIVALAADRWRITLIQAGGAWLQNVAYALIIGLLLLAGVRNWVGYYEMATVRGDPNTYVGRALRQLSPGRVPYLIENGDPGRARWGTRVIEFLAGGPYRSQPEGVIIAGEWPEALPPQSAVILHPDDQALAVEVENRYPGGVYWVQRNRQGDPVLFVYQLP